MTHETSTRPIRTTPSTVAFPAAGPADQTAIRLADLVGALSAALDVTEGQPPGHAARCCLLALRLADELQLPREEKWALYYGALLKDLGCSSNAAKMSYLFGADDRKLKLDVKTIDWQRLSENVKYVYRQVRPGAGFIQRALQFASLAVQGPQGPKQLVKIRCERGAAIARSLGFPEATATAILHLDEHFNGRGHPLGLRGNAISLLGRILCLCQTLEVFWREQGLPAARNAARERKGSWFDPQLVTAWETVSRDAEFCHRLMNEYPYHQLAAHEPSESPRLVDADYLDRIAMAFADVVDTKSPWTYQHSSRVAEIASGIAQSLEMPPLPLRELRRAALLHDIGKLGVSNLILDKPGKLTDEEFGAIKKHPQLSEQILGRVQQFGDMAALAGAHHERYNGRGYYRGIASSSLPIQTRILMIADVFEALTASRPYRAGLSQEQVIDLLSKDCGQGVCPTAFAGLLKWLDHSQLASRIEAQHQSVERLLDELTSCPGC